MPKGDSRPDDVLDSLTRPERGGPSPRRRGTTPSSAASRRQTVDLPDATSHALKVAAVTNRTTIQAVLAALATAYAEGDPRAQAIVGESLGS